jgi:hypothetical protein
MRIKCPINLTWLILQEILIFNIMQSAVPNAIICGSSSAIGYCSSFCWYSCIFPDVDNTFSSDLLVYQTLVAPIKLQYSLLVFLRIRWGNDHLTFHTHFSVWVMPIFKDSTVTMKFRTTKQTVDWILHYQIFNFVLHFSENFFFLEIMATAN